MANTDQNIFGLMKRFTSEIIPDARVVLFGSRARNDNDFDSDYDFLVISKDDIDENSKSKYRSLLRKKLAMNRIPAGIIIQSENDISEKRNLKGHLIRQIYLEGFI